MRKLLVKLTSRKFLLALGSFITLIANKQFTEAVVVVTAYLAAEGVLDHKAL